MMSTGSRTSLREPSNPTTDRVIELLGTTWDAEIARRIGVSRQRVLQIKQSLRVCHIKSPKPAIRRCKRCGDFLRSIKGSYCSLCSILVSAQEYITLICPVCGRVFERWASIVRAARKRNARHLYCSRYCRGLVFSQSMKKDKIKVMCEQCGKVFVASDYGVHHRKAYRNCKNDMEANSPNNLIVLCRSCHSKADRLGIIQKRGGDGKWVKNSG